MNKIKALGCALAITAALTSCSKKDMYVADPVTTHMSDGRMAGDSANILPGRWIVHYFCKNMVDMTANFDHSQLVFDSAGTIHAYGEVDSAIGNWNVAGGTLTINFTVGTRYSSLNGEYHLTVLTDHTISLDLVGALRKKDGLELTKLLVP